MIIFYFFLINIISIMGQEAVSIDEWRQITDVEELIGEWEAIEYLPYDEMPDPQFIEYRKIIIVSNDNDFIIFDMRIDYNYLFDYLSLDRQSPKEELWEYFIEPWTNDRRFGRTLFLEDYSIKILLKYPISQKERIVINNWYINQSGNKLKLRNALFFEQFGINEESIYNRK